MKKWKKSAASMLLLLLMVSVAACGRNNGTAADENAGTGNEAGVENNSGNTGLDGRPFDEILFDTDGDGIANVPEYYATTHGRKVVDDSKNIIDLVKHPNKFSAIIIMICLIVVAIIVLVIILIRKLIRRARNKNSESKEE